MHSIGEVVLLLNGVNGTNMHSIGEVVLLLNGEVTVPLRLHCA